MSVTPHPGKDGREPLTREKILDKALEILDAEGVKGLSMRRLGDALGVEAMVLYHHFPNKDAILDGLYERIIAETGPGLELDADADWKDIMMSGPAAAGRAIEAHPKAGFLFLGRKYTTEVGLMMVEAPLQILYRAGFRGQELVDAAHAVFAYAGGWYLLASGEGGSWSGIADEEVAAAPEGVAPLVSEYAARLRDWSGMEAGFRALLDGLEANAHLVRDTSG